MSSNSVYLIDADVFIQAKNFHYRFEFCKAFWDWLSKAHEAGLVFSIKKVRGEIKQGNKNDPVRVWAEALPNGFFLPDEHDSAVMMEYREVMQWNFTNTHYRQHAKNEFARHDKADAFLVAAAKAHGYTIVTQEKSNPASKKRVKVPDAANAFNLSNCVIYDLLTRHAIGNFRFLP